MSTPDTSDSPDRPARPRVVVVGGGFAGRAVVEGLASADVDVLLLDRNAYSTFQPLLYQVATGGLNPGDVTHSLRAFTARHANARFRQVTVTGVDTDSNTLSTSEGDSIDYDYLVLCCGVTANFFGIEGAAEYARSLYTRADSIRLRDTIFANLEAVAQGRPGAVEPSVVIVGAGPTGVEVAGMLAEMRDAMPSAYPEIDPSRVKVVLVEMGPEVLAPFEPAMRTYTEEELVKRGVELKLGTAVTKVEPDGVVLADGSRLPSAATVWASGVKVADQLGQWGLPQGRGGRIEVDDDMRVAGLPNVFAVGDVAAGTSDPLPQVAQPAIQGGAHAARQIRRLLHGRPTEALRYRDKGTAATIGRGDAVVQLPIGVNLKGVAAWLAWVAIHIVMLVGNRNRLATLANLTMRYLTGHRRLNVIVGDPPDDR